MMQGDPTEREGAGAEAQHVSYEVLPEIKEYERTSTTVINAYVMPIVASLPAARCGSRPRQARACAGAPAADAIERRPDHAIRRRPSGR